MIPSQSESSPSKCCWCERPLYRVRGKAGPWSPWMCHHQACWDRELQYAIYTTERDKKGQTTGGVKEWLFAPTPRQTEFAEATRRTKYTLFGGAKAVTKSYGLRWLLYRDCIRIPGLRCLLLRRTYGELESSHLLDMPLEKEKLAPVGAEYKSGAREFSFANGSLIRAGHCETDVDVAKFLSTQWDRIVFDEVVTFTLPQFLAIVSCARSAKEIVIAEGGAQVWAATNPGGRGAHWVHDLFVAKDPDREKFPDFDASQWGFVQGWLQDNPYIEPGYRQTLMNLPPILRRQWLDGDWNAFEGQFFDWQAAREQQPWHVADMGLVA